MYTRDHILLCTTWLLGYTRKGPIFGVNPFEKAAGISQWKSIKFCKKKCARGTHLHSYCNLGKVRMWSKQTHIRLQRKPLSLRIVIYLNQSNGWFAKSCRSEKYIYYKFSKKSEYRWQADLRYRDCCCSFYYLMEGETYFLLDLEGKSS